MRTERRCSLGSPKLRCRADKAALPAPHKGPEGEGNVFLNYILGLRELKKAVEKAFPGKVTLEAVKNIDAVPVWVAINTAVMLGIGRFPLMNPKKAANWLRGKDDVLLYGTDIEFIGYRDLAGRRMSIDGLLEVVKALNVELSLPSELKHSGRKLYLRTSSWAPDKSLRIWTEDEGNARLNMLTPFVGEPLAFLAENSDARGWSLSLRGGSTPSGRYTTIGGVRSEGFKEKGLNSPACPDGRLFDGRPESPTP